MVLAHDVSKQSAQEPQINTEQAITPQQEISAGQRQEQSVGPWDRPLGAPACPDNGSIARAQTRSRPTEGRRYRGHAP
jgi:hypothetical protein